MGTGKRCKSLSFKRSFALETPYDPGGREFESPGARQSLSGAAQSSTHTSGPRCLVEIVGHGFDHCRRLQAVRRALKAIARAAPSDSSAIAISDFSETVASLAWEP